MNGQDMQGQAIETSNPKDWAWRFWPAVPLYPFGRRRTIRQEVVKDTIWTFDQIQGVFYVIVPIRMTVVKLEAGGLLVYAPVAPTPECIRLVEELVAEYGEVKYIILPTSSGLEHKLSQCSSLRCTASVELPDQFTAELARLPDEADSGNSRRQQPSAFR
jgi:hypothetical protein